MNPRPFALDELEPDAEWLEDEQDIREENGGVHAEPLDGLERHLGRGLRILAQLEEAVARAHRAVLGHVASGLAHEPNGRDRCRLPATGEEKRRCDGVRHVEPSLQAASGAVKKAAV